MQQAARGRRCGGMSFCKTVAAEVGLPSSHTVARVSGAVPVDIAPYLDI